LKNYREKLFRDFALELAIGDAFSRCRISLHTMAFLGLQHAGAGPPLSAAAVRYSLQKKAIAEWTTENESFFFRPQLAISEGMGMNAAAGWSKTVLSPCDREKLPRLMPPPQLRRFHGINGP
jgi:hypothetical protein